MAKRISFDYDGTLSTDKGKALAKRWKAAGDTLYIITARKPSESEPVYKVADELGIPHSRVKFTSGKDKWTYVKILKIDKHVDNNKEQVDKVNKYTNAEGYLFEP